MSRKVKPSYANEGDTSPALVGGSDPLEVIRAAQDYIAQVGFPPAHVGLPLGVAPPGSRDRNPTSLNSTSLPPAEWMKPHVDPVADVVGAGLQALLPAPPTPHAQYCQEVEAMLLTSTSNRATYWLNVALEHEGYADYYDRLRDKRHEAAEGKGANVQARATTRAMGDTKAAQDARRERDKAMLQAKAVLAAVLAAGEATRVDAAKDTPGAAKDTSGAAKDTSGAP